MYEGFYGFKERPFSLLPDPDFLFLSDKHRMALDLLELAIFNQAGFCVISGEIGAGKTTLIRELLNRLGDDICVGLVSNTHPSFGELLQWITAAYDLDAGSADQFEQHKCFLDFVIQQYAENKRTLLIIDEAQNLSISAMEELRMLSNVNSERDLVLQVILVGQNQLREKLQQPELEQFAQRISLDYHLAGLDEQETRDYIRHRLTRAGGPADVFTEDACRTVYRCSEGIPRLINGICDICLVYGYSDNSPIVTPELVREVVEDQRNGHIRTPPEQITKHSGDATTTAFGSTLADRIQFPEQSDASERGPSLNRADSLISQVEDLQAKSPSAAETVHEDRDHPTEMTAPPAAPDAVPETILGSMEGMLLKETVGSTPASQPQKEFARTDSVRLANRHRPVVEPDQGSSANGESRPLLARMFMGLVLLTGIVAAGWLSWLAWDKHLVSLKAATDSTVPADDPVSDSPTQENVRKLAEQREAERLERERQEAEKRLAEQREAERLERERQEAEKRLAEQREAERRERERQEAEKRLAEQREAERLERERQEAEKRLAEQREAERLEQERQAARKRLEELRKAQRFERERKAAEKRLAEQREAQRRERERQEIERRLAEQIEAAELEAKRAAALSTWKKATGGIEWSEEIEEEEIE